MIKAIFFDVANTLLHKPAVYDVIINVLGSKGYAVDRNDLMQKHKLLSEVLEFPDQTSEQFYFNFNSHLLTSLGIIPSGELLTELFKKCSYLPWEPFDDTVILNRLSVPLGIISNWDLSLKDKLLDKINSNFQWILGSKELGMRKPQERFFQQIIDRTKLIPGEILVVGDSIRLDIMPARSLGMAATLVDRINLYPHAFLSRVKSLNELPLILNS